MYALLLDTSRYARTHDIAFLHTVSKVVAALHSDDALRRADPPTVAAALAENGAEHTDL